MFMVRNSGTLRCAFFLVSALVLGTGCSDFAVLAQTDDDSLAASLESARRKRDPVQLESLKTQLQQRLSHRPVRGAGRGRDGPAHHDRHLSAGSHPRQLPDQAGLADAGLTRDDGAAAPAGERSGQG